MKETIFWAALLTCVPAGIVAASVSSRIREAVFAMLVFSTVIIERLDYNFISRELYRGSARGIQISFLHFLAVILLGGTIFAPKSSHRRWVWPASLGFMLVYLFYCVLSVAMSEPKLFGLFELSKIFLGVVVFVAVATYVRNPRAIKVALLSLCAISVYVVGCALEQRYLWGVHRITGPFAHPNELSEYCCIIAAVLGAAAMSNLFASFRWLCAGCAGMLGICVVLTISRTGVVVYALVMMGVLASCISFRMSRQQVAALACAGLVALGVVYRASDTLVKRYGQASFEDEYFQESGGRGMYLRLAAMVVRDHFFGIGLNNWSYVVTEEYYPRINRPSAPYRDTAINMEGYSENELKHMIAPPAHNLAALTIGELGVPGFILFYAMWAKWFHMAGKYFRKRSQALVSRFGVAVFWGLMASFLQNLTEYGFRHPHNYFLIHILVGMLAATYIMRDMDGGLTAIARAWLANLRMQLDKDHRLRSASLLLKQVLCSRGKRIAGRISETSCGAGLRILTIPRRYAARS